MDTPSFKEDHISQIPALQLLQKLGYTYLSPAEAENLRGGKTSNILLDDILRKQLKEINSEKRISSTKTTYISDANIENGIRALKELPKNEGYIDWKYSDNIVFYVTEEYSVMRSTSWDHYIPDLVLFINGIPVCVIECKRPDMKSPLAQAISQ